jgi:hypothetical protein
VRSGQFRSLDLVARSLRADGVVCAAGFSRR